MKTTKLKVGILGLFVAATMPMGHAAGATEAVLSPEKCPVVAVSAQEQSFSSPTSTTSGLRTFRLSTSSPGGTALGLFQLHDGVDLNAFVERLRIALTGDIDERVQAGLDVSRQATFLGGTNAVAGRATAFTKFLWPGTYYLINYEAIHAHRDVTVRPLTVSDPVSTCVPSTPHAVIELADTADGPKYVAPEQLRAGKPVLVANRTDQVDEAVLMPLRSDVTDADLRRFFEALDTHQPPPLWPFTSTVQGMPVISPHHTAVIEPNLVVGRYALFTWVIDLDSGHMRAAGGMYRIVNVVA